MGEWKWTAGEWYGDESNKGIKTGKDARFYGISAAMSEAFNNEGKDLVLQYTVKHEQKIGCGGAYIKLLPEIADQTSFSGDSQYAIMFGPDVCGTATRKTHAIFHYGRTDENLLTKKNIRTETDQKTHLYTFIVHPDNTYEVRIDNKKVESGDLAADWDFLPSKMIKDPEASKPDDWVDAAKIDDPEDTKPEGWDDVPEMIPDPEAEMPEDWDEEEDGEWEAPMIDNPEYKGEWKPRQIDNPDYKGPWIHPEIENPEYFEDDKLHAVCSSEAPCTHVGFELWQVEAGTIFDNIIVTDSVEEAEAFAAETWEANKDAEQAAWDEREAARKAEEEAARAAAEAEEEADEEDFDEEDEDEEGDEL
jgi:calreticulin